MAEVAGVALGVGSLIIAAIQSYRETKDLLFDFKHAPKRLRDARRQVLLAELAFRKANERLLCHCVDESDAKKMLTDLKSPLWQKPDFRSGYQALLGDDQQCFEEAATLVLDKLDFLQKELKGFSALTVASAKAMKQRLRFAFQQSRTEKLLSELMDINQNFVALISLLLPQPEKIESVTSISSSPNVTSDLQRFRNVERSAQDLYRALGTACNDHKIHRALLNLSPDCSDGQRTHFTLAFSQNSLQDGDAGPKDPSIWLIVQSAFTESVEKAEAAAATASVLVARTKRTCFEISDGDDDQKRTRAKQRVRFQLPESLNRTKQHCPIPPQPSTPVFLNLCQHGKICHHLAMYHGLALPADEAIGYLDLSRGSKHLVYLKPRKSAIVSTSATSEMRSLQQLLVQSRSDDIDDELPLKHRLDLARKLATAVLHFHATSWLPSVWDSQRILVSEDSSSNDADDSRAPEPYAMTQIDKPSSYSHPPSATPSQMVVRNRLLFSLGIVLLELAYQRPLASLTSNVDRINVPPEDVPYRTADRLANRVSEKLGSNYAELVRKCVHCDFGNGFDMKKTRLQEAFYRSVVCELNNLIKSPSWICATQEA